MNVSEFLNTSPEPEPSEQTREFAHNETYTTATNNFCLHPNVNISNDTHTYSPVTSGAREEYEFGSRVSQPSAPPSFTTSASAGFAATLIASPLSPQRPPVGYGAEGSLTEDPDSPSLNQSLQFSPPPSATPADTLNTNVVGSVVGKKPKACGPCRSLKVRCDPGDPLRPELLPCRRCIKARRQCVPPLPGARRCRKSDNRVAELEEKVNALAALLPEGSAGLSTGGPATITAATTSAEDATCLFIQPKITIPFNHVSGSTAASTLGMPHSLTDAAMHHAASWTPDPTPKTTCFPPNLLQHLSPTQMTSPTSPDSQAIESTMSASKKRRMDFVLGKNTTATPMLKPALTALQPLNHADVIDRGILSPDQADRLWHRYVEVMMLHMPAVIFPSDATAAEVRRDKPTLFLAIMAAAASEIPTLETMLVKELMHVLAYKMVVMGEKYLELVQALQITVIWYNTPGPGEELKIYQLAHSAATMAMDIGLGRIRRRPPWYDELHSSQPLRHNSSSQDPCSVEARRTWLVCFLVCSNISIMLQRPKLIRWTRFMEECLEILRTSPAATATDAYLCHIVWTSKMVDSVDTWLEGEGPAAPSFHLTDRKSQMMLRLFVQEVDQYKNSIPPELMKPCLRLSFDFLILHLHEIVLCADSADKTEPSSPHQEVSVENTPHYIDQHIKSLSACLMAIDDVMDAFLSMDVQHTIALPAYQHVFVTYAILVLIKLHFASSSPTSGLLSKILDPKELHINNHLDALLNKVRRTASECNSRQAAKAAANLSLLKSWISKKGNEPSRHDYMKMSCPWEHRDAGHHRSSMDIQQQGLAYDQKLPSANSAGSSDFFLQAIEPHSAASSVMPLESLMSTTGAGETAGRNVGAGNVAATPAASIPTLNGYPMVSVTGLSTPSPEGQDQQQQLKREKLMPSFSMYYEPQQLLSSGLGGELNYFTTSCGEWDRALAISGFIDEMALGAGGGSNNTL